MTFDQALQDLIKPGITAEELLDWPPDVFAVCSWLLAKTGAYKNIVLPKFWVQRKAPSSWQAEVRDYAKAWRESPSTPAAWIKERWNRITSAQTRTRAIQEINSDENLCGDLLDLVAVCDETCVGIGIGNDDPFIGEAASILLHRHDQDGAGAAEASSLTKNIDSDIALVLPKLHTPNCGITLRSLTHHLALVEPGEVKPLWSWASTISEENHGLNVLLIPWPEETSPHQFSASGAGQDGRHADIDGFGFFEYTPQSIAEGAAQKFERVLEEARKIAARIDMVILPEASLADTQSFDVLLGSVRKVFPDAFFLAGVVNKTEKGTFNIIRSSLVGSLSGERYTSTQNQAKHHRWKLERNQILQYQLAANLDPSLEWWEAIDISRRELYFYNFCSWLTFCGLVCEDLARQDPVADIIRAVGPNLLVALLMDAPQLKSRWPSRYATVFADDPGTSVLTCTSLGMAGLSMPPDMNPEQARPRTIALWKDIQGHPKEITVERDADAVILTLVRTNRKETTADGRDDQGGSYFLELVHVDQVPRK